MGALAGQDSPSLDASDLVEALRRVAIGEERCQAGTSWVAWYYCTFPGAVPSCFVAYTDSGWYVEGQWSGVDQTQRRKISKETRKGRQGLLTLMIAGSSGTDGFGGSGLGSAGASIERSLTSAARKTTVEMGNVEFRMREMISMRR